MLPLRSNSMTASDLVMAASRLCRSASTCASTVVLRAAGPRFGAVFADFAGSFLAMGMMSFENGNEVSGRFYRGLRRLRRGGDARELGAYEAVDVEQHDHAVGDGHQSANVLHCKFRPE